MHAMLQAFKLRAIRRFTVFTRAFAVASCASAPRPWQTPGAIASTRAAVMGDVHKAIRLYIGGLPEAVTAQQLAGRFTSFGSVSDVALIPGKLGNVERACRGFAYVSFTPKDDMALQRCLSVYNGCKWLGGILRVEKAREHFLSKLQKEWQTPPDESSTAEHVQPDSAEPIRIPTPASSFVKRKLMTVQANKVKHIFAPIKGKQLSTLSWESPPDPPAVLKRKAAEQAAAQHSRKRLAVSTPLVNSQPDMHNQSEVLPPPPEPITATAAAHKKEKKPSKQQQQEHDRKGTATQNLSLAQNAEDKSEKADVQPESSSSSDAGVVDFMSDDDDDAVAEGQYTNAAQGTALGAVHSIHADMSRFSSDDEEAQQAKHATEGSFRQQQTRLSRFASLDDEPDGGTAYQAPTTASLSHTAEGVDLSRVDSDDDKAAPASQAGAAVTVAAQLTVMQAATNQHTDLSRFNSDSDSENEVGPSASNAPAVKTDVSVGAADLVAQGAAESSTSDRDVSPSSPFSNSQEAAADMPEITPTLSAQATAPSKPGTQAGFAAQTVAQLSHGAQVQPVSSEPADESMSDQADGMEASSDESDELESQSLPESSPADHIMQADTEPTDMCSKPVAPVQQAATRQPATQQPDLTSAGSSDLSSAGGDPSHSDEEAPDLDETQHHVQEQQSSGGSSDLGSAEDQGQDQSQITHDNQHEDEASDKSDAMSHGSSSGSEAISDRVGEPVDGTAHIDEEAAVQTAAQTLRDPQQEAPLYPDLAALKHGAGFWHQNEVVSQRDWQAQRQALQEDYRAKRRAATKHTHRTRKAAWT